MIRAGVLARVRASIGEEPAPHACCGPEKACGAGHRITVSLAALFGAQKGLRRPKALPLESAGAIGPGPLLWGARNARGCRTRLVRQPLLRLGRIGLPTARAVAIFLRGRGRKAPAAAFGYSRQCTKPWEAIVRGFQMPLTSMRILSPLGRYMASSASGESARNA